MSNITDILAKIQTLESKLQSFLASRETAQGVLIPAREYMECYKLIIFFQSIKDHLVRSPTNYNINTVSKLKTLY